MAQNAQNWTFGLKILENKCQIWNHQLRNRMHAKFCSKIRKMMFFDTKGLNLGIWARNSKNENEWKISNIPNCKILGRFGSLCNFFCFCFCFFLRCFDWFCVALCRFASFSLVSGRFGSLQVLVNTVLRCILLCHVP